MAELVASLVPPIASSPGLHYRNPRFPVNVKLPDNLECGTRIYVHGAVTPDATRFTFNLKNAEQDASNYFHLNPRFGDANVVVRNSRVDDAWGDEERDGDNPFVPGEPFLLAVTATVDGYDVEVNGSYFTTFNHRPGMPLCDITHVTMAGDVVIHGIHVPLSSMPIPLALRIPGKASLGDMVCINGEVPDGAGKFAVNLQCGQSDNADIMLHFNPRFGDNILVCNSRCAESWDAEERQEGLPIAPGDKFSLCIAAGAEAFNTYMNGVHFSTFPHRLNMCAACTLTVNGDVTVGDVTIASPSIRLPHHLGDIKTENFDEKSTHAFYPTNPSVLKVPDSFGPGKVVYVSGLIDSDPSRFKVNLQYGEEEDSQVALHLNPRWDDDEGPVIVLNTFDGEWGEETRAPNAMGPGSSVDIHILCKDDGYCVFLDGNEIVDSFPHRLECGQVSHVAVDGCIAVSHVFSS